MRYFFILLLASCSSVIPLPKKTVKEFSVSSKLEARKILETRQRYLSLLFENNEMPVYVEKKWTQSCVEENKIGKIEENQGSVILISELYLDSALKEGFCSDKFYVRKYYVAYVYCEDQGKVLDIRFPYTEKLKLDKRNLCYCNYFLPLVFLSLQPTPLTGKIFTSQTAAASTR